MEVPIFCLTVDKTARYPLGSVVLPPLYQALRVEVWGTGGALPIGHVTHIWNFSCRAWKNLDSPGPEKGESPSPVAIVPEVSRRHGDQRIPRMGWIREVFVTFDLDTNCNYPLPSCMLGGMHAALLV